MEIKGNDYARIRFYRDYVGNLGISSQQWIPKGKINMENEKEVAICGVD